MQFGRLIDARIGHVLLMFSPAFGVVRGSREAWVPGIWLYWGWVYIYVGLGGALCVSNVNTLVVVFCLWFGKAIFGFCILQTLCCLYPLVGFVSFNRCGPLKKSLFKSSYWRCSTVSHCIFTHASQG